ncbi:hypothetical protein BDA96_06G057900 [Sorghum bicolor]|uniref:Uncharacterized protein n=2 Tax=Sorghum bicolor TaxID=4558 RepID=A0A921QP99_SORBI|nr:hypothetical protein BDA96_10G029900 [Sorghum bicolor]KAG0525453.1 hypothetical protein BDA96_06G057900 [Sorghum bicolor]KXG26106.1 hypothetical protein SORBI_3006G051400 [Sorghum bicolor]
MRSLDGPAGRGSRRGQRLFYSGNTGHSCLCARARSSIIGQMRSVAHCSPVTSPGAAAVCHCLTINGVADLETEADY